MKTFNKKHKPKHLHTKKKYRRIVDCDKIIITKYVPSQYMMWIDLSTQSMMGDGIGVVVNKETYEQLHKIAKYKQHIIYDNVVFDERRGKNV